MEKRIIFLILSLVTPAAAHCADISGFVRNASNKPVAGAQVVYLCNGKSFPATTSSYGRYRVRGLPNVTWCSVTVNKVEIFSRINSGSGSKEVNLRN